MFIEYICCILQTTRWQKAVMTKTGSNDAICVVWALGESLLLGLHFFWYQLIFIAYIMESLTIKPPQWWLASPTGWWPSWMRHRVMVERWGTPNTDKTLFPWVGVIENIAKRHFLPQNLNIDILFGSLYSWKLFILLNIKCTWHEQGFVMKPYHSSSLSRSTASLSENWTSISMSSASASSSSCLFNFWSGKVLT